MGTFHRAKTLIDRPPEMGAPAEDTEPRTPEQIVGEFFARVPRRSPADLIALARAQGVQPVSQFEDLLGPANVDEFDVDAFLAAREQWRSEEAQLEIALPELDDAVP